MQMLAMIGPGQLLSSVAELVNSIFTILYWLLIIRIILTWFQIHPQTTYHEILNMLYQVTDPILLPFRRLPLQVGMMDFSPIVALLVMDFIRSFIVSVLHALAQRLM